MDVRLRALAAASPSVLAIAAASVFVFAPPAEAATASCTPTANGQAGSSSRTNASGVQICQGGDTGIAYQATGGALMVNLNNDPITGHAININDDGNARNLTVNIGLPSAGYAAAPVLATDSSSNAVKLVSSGGNILFAAYAGAPISYTGSGSPSFAVNLQTSASGAINATTNDKLNDTVGSGLSAQTVNGAINLTANANITAGLHGVIATASGTGAVNVALGNGVTIATPKNGLYAYSAGGLASAALGVGDTITTAAPSNGVGVYVESDQAPAAKAVTASATIGANTAISLSGDGSAALQVTNQGQGLGGVAVVIGDGANLAATGNDDAGVYAATTIITSNSVNGAGDVSVQVGNNDAIAVNAGSGVQTAGGNAGILAASKGGNVSVLWSGAGGSVAAHTAGAVPSAGIYATTTGAGSVTVSTGVGTTVESDNGDGVAASAVSGAVNVSVQGGVTATGGDAINAVTNGSGSVTVTAGSAANPVALVATNPFNDAVFAASAAGGNVSVTTFGTAANEVLGETTGAGAITISVNGVVTPAALEDAIYATGQDGAIAIASNGTLKNGIFAQASGAGNVTVSTIGTVAAPGDYSAIYATSGSGDVTIATNGPLVNNLNATTGGGGVVNVTINGNITNTQPYDSVYAASVDGAVTVNVQSGTITGATGGDGVDARADGRGAATVTLGGGVAIDPPTVGVLAKSVSGIAAVTLGDNDAISAADVVNSSAVTAHSGLAPPTSTLTASITTGANDSFVVNGNVSAGLLVFNNGGGPGGVSIQTGACDAITVTGDTVAGVVSATSVLASAYGASVNGTGDATVKIGAANTILINAGNGQNVLEPVSGGVVAASAGGNVDVEWTGAGGSVTVNGSSGFSTAGLFADTSPGGGGAATLTVVTGAGTAITSNSGVGVLAANGNTGATSVVSNGPITAIASGPGDFAPFLPYLQSNFGPFLTYLRSTEYTAGLVVVGAGAVSVASNAPISVTGGDGIDAIAGGALSVTNTGVITADQSAIRAGAGGGLTITNTGAIQGAGSTVNPVVGFGAVGNAALVNGSGGVISSTAGSPSDLAISAVLAVAGTASLSNAGMIVGRIDLSQTADATFSNAGTWLTSGVSSFTAASALNNTGTIQAKGAVSFAALQTLTNSGVIDLRATNVAPGDSLTVSGAFVGSGAGKLILNATLGTAGSGSSCGALADCLTVGSSSGVTGLVVHDVASAGAAGPNTVGVLIVNGSSSAANFVLDPSSPNYNPQTHMLDEGLFSYTLGYNASTRQERLYGLPDVAAFDLPTLITAAQNIWYAAEPWQDRQTEFLSQAASRASSREGPQLWLKAVGDETQRTASASFAIPGVSTFQFSTSYRQETGGLIGGVDVGGQPRLLAGDSFLAGVAVGYVASHVSYSHEPIQADYSGAVVALYGSYASRALFIDAVLNTNLLQAKYEKAGLAGFSAKPDVTAIGGSIDVGRRWTLTPAYYVEPIATLTYVSADLQSSAIAGAAVDFGAGSSGQDSGRGGVGLRFGAQPASFGGGALIDWSVTARAWDEFAAANKAAVAVGASDMTFEDRFAGAFGEVAGRLGFQSPDGRWLGGVDAGVTFKDGFTSETVVAMVRYNW